MARILILSVLLLTGACTIMKVDGANHQINVETLRTNIFGRDMVDREPRPAQLPSR